MNFYVKYNFFVKYQCPQQIRYGKIWKLKSLSSRIAAFDNRLRHLYWDYTV